MLSLTFAPHWELLCLARFPAIFSTRSLSRFLPFEVHNFAAAVQSSGPRGARLRGAAGYHSIRLHRGPRHLQRGDDALRAAAGHHRADAQRTHAPPGEDGHFQSDTNMVSFTVTTLSFLKKEKKRRFRVNIHLYLLCISVMLLSTESGPAGPDGDHQQQHAGCPAGPG